MLVDARRKGFDKPDRWDGEYDPGDEGPVPLGYTEDGRYIFSEPRRRRVIALNSQQLMAPAGLADMAPIRFWADQFPKYDRKGTPTGDFSAKNAGDALMEACRKEGSYSLSRVRGRGVWLEGEKVVVNLGQAVEHGGFYRYVCFEALPELGEEKFDAFEVFDWLTLFNWQKPQDAELMLGWLAVAPICGALDWRPHVFVCGAKMTGKTTLFDGITELLDPLVMSLDGSSTEAGIRQTLLADSRPIVLDEFEADGNRGRMDSIIKLARSWMAPAEYLALALRGPRNA